MFCIWCGAEIEDDCQFCPHCGSNVQPGGVAEPPVQQPVSTPPPAPEDPLNQHPVRTPPPQQPPMWNPPPRRRSKAPLIAILVVGICIVAAALIFLGIQLLPRLLPDWNLFPAPSAPPSASHAGIQPSVRPDSPALPSGSPAPSPSLAPSPEPSPELPAYVIAGSDSRYLTRDDLIGLTDDELRIARNEIYARRGRLFNDAALQDYFDQQPWYQGTVAPEDFTQAMLNDFEVQNANLILAYENERKGGN